MEQVPAAEVPHDKSKGHRWKPGHPKYGGRRKRDKSTLPGGVEACIRHSLSPLDEMCRIFLTGKLADGDGRIHDVSTQMRVKILTKIAEHTHPKAPAFVAGQVDHNHTINVEHIMRDPELAEAAERLAFALIEQESGPTPAFQQWSLPPASVPKT
jgi:hypothetical protein